MSTPFIEHLRSHVAKVSNAPHSCPISDLAGNDSVSRGRRFTQRLIGLKPTIQGFVDHDLIGFQRGGRGCRSRLQSIHLADPYLHWVAEVTLSRGNSLRLLPRASLCRLVA